MTDKQYYCQNGDLIEVGKEYNWSDLRDEGDKVKVIGIDTDRGVPVAFVRGEYWGMKLDEMQSLWQEQPDKEGWIKHTTGKQPVGDDVMVEYIISNNRKRLLICESDALDWSFDDGPNYITHYRIIEQPTNEENSEVNELEEIKKSEMISQLDEGFFKDEINEWKPYDILDYISDYLQKKGV